MYHDPVSNNEHAELLASFSLHIRLFLSLRSSLFDLLVKRLYIATGVEILSASLYEHNIFE
jgi:hypothetical protein